MRIGFSFLVLLLTFTNISYAQDIQIITDQIDWNYLYLEINRDSQKENEDRLWIHHNMPLKQKIENPELQFKQGTFVNLTAQELVDLNLSDLSTEIKIDWHLLSERKKHLLDYTIFPFRLNPQTGIAEKLTSYSLELKYSTSQLKSSATRNYAQNSLLANGNWYKIKIDTTGGL
jgi:hypothetical protein